MPPRKDVSLAKSIGKKIKTLREKKFPGRGSQGVCAEAYGTAQATWSRWEHGTVTPTDSEQRKLAKFFNIRLEQLRGERVGIGAPNDEATEMVLMISDFIGQLSRMQSLLVAGTARPDLVKDAVEVGIELLGRAELLSQEADASDSEHKTA